MHKIHEVLRLYHQSQMSERAIASSLMLSRATIGKIIRRADEAGITWPLPDDMTESQLERALFPRPQGRPKNCFEPNWNEIHMEMRKKGVTLQLLWMEYKEQHPDGYQHTQFCERYRLWKKSLQVTMRHEHRAGEKMFVDYAGPTARVIDPETGEIQEAQIFVATLGASSYTYVEAQWSQNLESFIQGHVHAFEFFGGVPKLLVPDNLKSGVNKSDRYEPTLNRTYFEMASYYGCAVLPARPRKPRDKAKVEAAVLLAERWILAVLRKRTFFSLDELNVAIRELVIRLNEKPFQKLEGSRKSLFEAVDKPALQPLRETPYEFATWRTARVNIDYHVAVQGTYYSVPYPLVGQEVGVRCTQRVIEIFHKGNRVASHVRGTAKGQFVTDSAHRPRSHQAHAEWTPSRLINWGNSIGPNTGILVSRILDSKRHPEQGYRSCLGLLSLSKQYSGQRLERAAEKALLANTISLASVKTMLKKGMEQLTLPLHIDNPTPMHSNVRGAAYYQSSKQNIVH
ncbi:IS21 family transposase [Alicyclobacillus fastidiosus]|uniref:IS21 family transposase n=1 Tax=Alicyclobacillus fastidiosus TaxID=392011 RepID=A0ABV5AFM0_9BACL|nr:IS21 family transposase [Alicyclobacillus fastidiosus]WEH09574.1 IS21 family transposase [Alicyclobacillus fastidiosus]